VTITVDRPIELPSHQAYSGSEIVDDDGRNGGFITLVRSHNSLYDQHRSVLLMQSTPLATPILAASSDTTYYKVPAWGQGNLTETATVRLYVTEGGTPPGATTIVVTQGANTATFTMTGASTTHWVTTASALTVDDNAAELDIAVVRSGPGSLQLHAIVIEYVRARTSLPALAAGGKQYASTGFCPLDVTNLAAGERPVTPALLYQLHEGGKYLFERVGICVCDSWRSADYYDTGDTLVMRKQVPYGVATLRVYLRGQNCGWAVTTSKDSASGTFGGSHAWTSAQDLDVSGLADETITLVLSGTSGGLSAVSMLWKGRALP
jgi:hypothetical protein